MVSPELKKAHDEGYVLGLKQESAKPVSRLDIDQLLKQHPDTFNLFLLALVEMQKDGNATKNEKAKPQPKMGWYELGGIHGLPSRNWDNVDGRSQPDRYGYCTHASVLFPLWHRPYMALMEQEIYYNIAEIAETFKKDKKRWQDAAKLFRMPYMDWFRPRKFDKDHAFPGVGPGSQTKFDWLFSLPRILMEKKVMVYMPEHESELTEIDNPLYSFKFPKAIDEDLRKYLVKSEKSTIRTTRTPPVESVEVSDTKALDDTLDRVRESGVIMMLNFFNLSTYSDYLRWSNYAEVSGGGHGSIESLHNDYHDYLGGGGHIGDPKTAGFDPLFFLHHTNVDRLIALWQATHPKRWFPDKTPEGFTSTTPLYPFRSYAEGGWWTADLARKCEDLGYTYPEIEKSNNPQEVFNTVGLNYIWSLQQRPPGFGSDPPEAMKPIDLAQSKVFGYGGQEPVPALGDWKMSSQVKQVPLKLNRQLITRIPDTEIEISKDELVPANVHIPEGATPLRQWFVDSLVKKQALNGTFTIYVFVGGDDNITLPYEREPGLAGTNYIFTSSSDSCSNCARQEEEGLIVSNTLPITPILLDYVKQGTIKSIEPEDVVPFMKTNLQIRITDSKNEPKDPHQVDGFRIGVNSKVLYYEEGNLKPIEGALTKYPEIDAGLPVITTP